MIECGGRMRELYIESTIDSETLFTVLEKGLKFWADLRHLTLPYEIPSSCTNERILAQLMEGVPFDKLLSITFPADPLSLFMPLDVLERISHFQVLTAIDVTPIPSLDYGALRFSTLTELVLRVPLLETACLILAAMVESKLSDLYIEHNTIQRPTDVNARVDPTLELFSIIGALHSGVHTLHVETVAPFPIYPINWHHGCCFTMEGFSHLFALKGLIELRIRVFGSYAYIGDECVIAMAKAWRYIHYLEWGCQRTWDDGQALTTDGLAYLITHCKKLYSLIVPCFRQIPVFDTSCPNADGKLRIFNVGTSECVDELAMKGLLTHICPSLDILNYAGHTSGVCKGAVSQLGAGETTTERARCAFIWYCMADWVHPYPQF